jgi:WD40 repeat protein
MSYDAFISYSHAVDDQLAPALQDALQRFAKPWHRRRALRIFRDKTSLSATPGLWSSIVDALDSSTFFVLLASPAAAQSDWVNREVAHWLDRHGESRLLPVVTEGEWVWDDDAGDFDWGRSDAVPPQLRKAFLEEPLYVDLRWARDENQLSLRHTRFRDHIADLAATIHGTPKDELEGQDVRQHRKTMRLAWSAGSTLLGLLIVSVVAAVLALGFAADARASAIAEAKQRRQAVEALEATRTARAAERLAKEDAQRSAAEADEQRNAAVKAEKAEARERTRAEEALRRAIEAQKAAEQSETEALAKARLAGSRQLASQALREFNTDPNRALLLAIEAVRTERTSEARDSLFATVQEASATGLVATLQIPSRSERHQVQVIHDVTVTTDGRFAAGLAKVFPFFGKSDLVVWDISVAPPVTRVIPQTDLRTPQILIGATGRIVLTSDGHSTRQVQLWDAETGRTLLPEPLSSKGAHLSPDQRHFLVITGEALLAIDSSTGQPRWLQPGRFETFAPDGHAVVGRTQSGRMVLWRLDREPSVMAPEIPLGAAEDRLSFPSFDESGHLLASVTGDGKVKVFDVSTGQLVGTTLGSTNPLARADLSPDGQIVVASDNRGAVRAFRVADGTVSWEYRRLMPEAIDQLGFSPRGTSVLVANVGAQTDRASRGDTGRQADPDRTTILDAANGSERIALDARSLVFGANERYAFMQSRVKGVSGFAVWDLEKQVPISANLKPGRISRTQDGRFIVSAPTDTGHGKLLVWDGEDPTREPRTLPSTGSYEMAFRAQRVLAFTADRRIARLWDLTARFEEQLTPSSTRNASKVAVSSNGALAAIADESGIRLTKLSSGETRPGPLLPDRQRLKALAFSPGGEYLVLVTEGDRVKPSGPDIDSPLGLGLSGAARTTLLVWRVQEGVAIREESVRRYFFDEGQLAFSGNGKVLSVRDAPRVQVYSLHDLTRLGEVTPPEREVAPGRGTVSTNFVLDDVGEHMFTADGEAVTAWDVATGAKRWERRMPETSDWGRLSFDPSRRHVRIKIADLGYVLDAANGAVVRTGPILIGDGILNSDATLLIAGREAQLYDGKTLRPIGAPLLPTDTLGFLRPVFFTDDGRYLMAVVSGAVLRWRIDEEYLLARACVLAGRNLTRAEWKDFGLPKGYTPTCSHWPLER